MYIYVRTYSIVQNIPNDLYNLDLGNKEKKTKTLVPDYATHMYHTYTVGERGKGRKVNSTSASRFWKEIRTDTYTCQNSRARETLILPQPTTPITSPCLSPKVKVMK